MAGLSRETLDIANYQMHTLGGIVGRYSIPVSIGSKWDLIITLSGSNWSLGTTDRRFAKFYIGRRYNGNFNTAEIFGNGARFHGTLGNFASSGVGVLVETSNASSFVFQIHNSYSSGPTSGFMSHIECYSAGKPTLIETYTGGNYTSNPF